MKKLEWVLHIVLTAPRMAGMRFADALVFITAASA